MDPVRSTNYFADIPKVGLPGPVIPHLVSNEAFHGRLVADFYLLALMLATGVVVVTTTLHWSH